MSTTAAAMSHPATPFPDVAVGDRLGELVLDVSATMIVGAALASRDFEPVHHDRDAARAAGMPDIFLNILATTGLVVRYVTDWAGPDAVVSRSAVRLGVPHCAGERLTLSGAVTSVEDDGRVAVAVRGRNDRGDHVTGTVELRLATGAAT